MISTLAPPPTDTDSRQRLARARALDAEIRALDRRRKADLARLVAHVAAFDASGGYRDLGFASLAHYTQATLGWRAKKTRELMLLRRRLGELPLLRDAFSAGELDWTKAVIAARAAEQDPQSEAEWCQDAQELSKEQLRDKAADALGEPRKTRVSFELTPEQAALWRDGVLALRSEGLDLDEGGALVELVRRALQPALAAEGGSAGSSRFRVLLERCPSCEETALANGDEPVPLSPDTAERLVCDAEVQEPDARTGKPRVSRTVPPSVRNAVLARAKGRCEIPGCSHRAYLDLHHNRGWRAGHDPDDVLLICGVHHDAIHAGRLRIRGSFRSGLRVLLADGSELGSRDPSGARDPSRDAGARAREDAVAALTRLGLPRGEARRRLVSALKLEPGIQGAQANRLVRAVLAGSPG